jgi:flagellar biosynthesis protein FlhF
MRYIKIRATNYNEAIKELKKKHGDEAIPISHKYVKEGGFLNSKFFAKDVVELTAAVQERKRSSASSNVDYTVGDDAKKDLSSGRKEDAVNIDSINKTIDALNNNIRDFKTSPQESNAKRDPLQEKAHDILKAAALQKRDSDSSGKDYIERDNDSMKKDDIQPVELKNFEKEFDEIKDTLKKLVQDKGNIFEHHISEEETTLDPYYDVLKKNDFDNEECNRILKSVKNSVSKDDLNDQYKIEKSLKDLLKSKIVTTGPIKLGNKKKIMMFMGPTGVGKTTTMAKLGALYSLRESHKVLFITIDNYRIAATEQLKKYAEIMRIPIHAINDQKEFRSVIAKEDAEIILVDTSGRSHRNELKIAEIKSFADMIDYDFEKILCVSANTKKDDLNDVFKAFDIMNFNSVVITKVDETSFLGNVVDIADKYNKPISYFTNGQEVPNDIEVADPDTLVDMIVGNTIQ